MPLLRHATSSFPFTHWVDGLTRWEGKDHIIRLQASGDCITAQVCVAKASISMRLQPIPRSKQALVSTQCENQPSLDSAAGEGVARSQPCGEYLGGGPPVLSFDFPGGLPWLSTHSSLKLGSVPVMFPPILWSAVLDQCGDIREEVSILGLDLTKTKADHI